jgi:hypothetical protein
MAIAAATPAPLLSAASIRSDSAILSPSPVTTGQPLESIKHTLHGVVVDLAERHREVEVAHPSSRVRRALPGDGA